MNKFQKIFVLILTLLISKTIWNREIILKRFHKTNITLENRKSIGLESEKCKVGKITSLASWQENLNFLNQLI